MITSVLLYNKVGQCFSAVPSIQTPSHTPHPVVHTRVLSNKPASSRVECEVHWMQQLKGKCKDKHTYRHAETPSVIVMLVSYSSVSFSQINLNPNIHFWLQPPEQFSERLEQMPTVPMHTLLITFSLCVCVCLFIIITMSKHYSIETLCQRKTARVQNSEE